MVLKVIVKYILLIGCLLWCASLQAQNISRDEMTAIKQLTHRANKEVKTLRPRLEKLFDKGIVDFLTLPSEKVKQ